VNAYLGSFLRCRIPFARFVRHSWAYKRILRAVPQYSSWSCSVLNSWNVRKMTVSSVSFSFPVDPDLLGILLRLSAFWWVLPGLNWMSISNSCRLSAHLAILPVGFFLVRYYCSARLYDLICQICKDRMLLSHAKLQNILFLQIPIDLILCETLYWCITITTHISCPLTICTCASTEPTPNPDVSISYDEVGTGYG
jgi:hypothetical protein